MDLPSTRPRTARTTSTRNKTAKTLKKPPMALLLKKKAECDSRALKIVERSIEPGLSEDWLLENLGQINKAHMDDIVEERSIVKLCGYPLCDNPLKKIVKKQYEISTLKNKVYDVSRVANFCSYSCFTATEYLMEQMLTSPLWHRDQEEIPKFKLFAKSKSRSKSPPGVEVNLVGIQLPEDNDDDEEISDRSLSKKEPKVEENKKRVTLDEQLDDPTKKTCGEKYSSQDNDQAALMQYSEPGPKTIEEEEEEDNDRGALAVEERAKNDRCQISQSANSNAAFVESSTGVKKTERRKVKKAPISFETLATRVENSFREWITEETICLLCGKDAEKQQILDNVRIEERYAILCKKLNNLQLEEERDSSNDRIGQLKPAPEFAALREEAKGLELKVRAFYQGKTVIDRNEKKPEESVEQQDTQVVLPMTDIHAPKALRRRIFLDKLNRVLPDLLRALGGNEHGTASSRYSYTSERCATVRSLVTTFSLSSTNITFKTPEWTLVALIIIKLLAFIDPRMKHLLESKQASLYTSMILLSYKLDSNYLERLAVSLTTPTSAKIIQESSTYS